MFRLDVSITAFATAYAFALGIAYLKGFWACFDLDFAVMFKFISPLDVLKAALLPVLAMMVSSAGLIYAFDLDELHEDTFNKKLEQNSRWKVMKPVYIFAFPCILLVISLFIFFSIYFSIYTYFNAIYPIILSATAWTLFISSRKILANINHVTRIVIITAFIFMPSLVYCYGLIDGVDAKKGNKPVESLLANNCSYFPNPQFISAYSSNLILYSPSVNAICITPVETIRLRTALIHK